MAQRDQALSIASARHLLAQGHIDKKHHDRICTDCSKKMKAKTRPAPRRAAPAASQPFGSLSAGPMAPADDY